MSNAPWRNFPVVPDAGYMTYVNLRAGGNEPPHGATYVFPGGGLRVGNNTPVIPTEMVSGKRFPGHNLLCVPDVDARKSSRTHSHAAFNHGFSGSTYLV